ncbi:hypothetical protein FA15DRAFT_383428 [Coprinopsis marcescibilis]|uniref:Uncharacterized protein n=1 Tax=Coprinopsis marcescibilis TaxID=230819 RepID=A0A5C3L9P9_COPMA|nr:hypothetical protein FA15DRAFT_383428 [Coprinopsis marcescibilis]
MVVLDLNFSCSPCVLLFPESDGTGECRKVRCLLSKAAHQGVEDASGWSSGQRQHWRNWFTCANRDRRPKLASTASRPASGTEVFRNMTNRRPPVLHFDLFRKTINQRLPFQVSSLKRIASRILGLGGILCEPPGVLKSF